MRNESPMVNDNNKTAIEERSTLQEEQYAWKAYLAGRTLQAIADDSERLIGRRLSRATVHRRIEAERVRIAAEVRASAEEHRATALARLDGMIEVTVAQIDRMLLAIKRLEARVSDEGELDFGTMHEKAEKVLASATANLRALEERRAKLLGLDAPTQVEATVTVKDAHDLAMEELAAEMDARVEA